MKILIVDDDLTSRTIMKKIVGEFGECIIAENGENALAEFTHAWSVDLPFDLIILDVNMDDISGIQVLKQIRDIEKKICQERTCLKSLWLPAIQIRMLFLKV